MKQIHIIFSDEFVSLYSIEWGYLTAGINIALIPILVLMLIFQKQMVRGLTLGVITTLNFYLIRIIGKLKIKIVYYKMLFESDCIILVNI